jgi:hypothetical protein
MPGVWDGFAHSDGRGGNVKDRPKKPREPLVDAELQALRERADMIMESTRDAVRRLKLLQAQIDEARSRRVGPDR